MAVSQLKDGRWVVRGRKGFWPDEPDRTTEYFGRGADAETAARARDDDLTASKGKRRAPAGPSFIDLAKAYLAGKNFNPNSRKHLRIRLSVIIGTFLITFLRWNSFSLFISTTSMVSAFFLSDVGWTSIYKSRFQTQ